MDGVEWIASFPHGPPPPPPFPSLSPPPPPLSPPPPPPQLVVVMRLLWCPVAPAGAHVAAEGESDSTVGAVILTLHWASKSLCIYYWTTVRLYLENLLHLRFHDSANRVPGCHLAWWWLLHFRTFSILQNLASFLSLMQTSSFHANLRGTLHLSSSLLLWVHQPPSTIQLLSVLRNKSVLYWRM